LRGSTQIRKELKAGDSKMGVGSNLWFDVRKPSREIETRNIFFITGPPRLLILFERFG
jgi:hypothetical protein